MLFACFFGKSVGELIAIEMNALEMMTLLHAGDNREFALQRFFVNLLLAFPNGIPCRTELALQRFSL